MSLFVYCGKLYRELPIINHVQHLKPRRLEGGGAPSNCSDDDVIVWWGPHWSVESFRDLLGNLLGVCPKIIVFAPPAEMRSYLDVFADNNRLGQSLGKLKIFPSDPSLDAVAVDTLRGEWGPTGKWLDPSGTYAEIELCGKLKWLCNYSSETDSARKISCPDFVLNPFESLHEFRYVVGNAGDGVTDGRLLLYAHTTQYDPSSLLADLHWWPEALKDRLWLVLYSGGEVNATNYPTIEKINGLLPRGRFARHPNFLKSGVLAAHEQAFDSGENFAPELPEPIHQIAISILCQGYLSNKREGAQLMTKEVLGEVFGESWTETISAGIRAERGGVLPSAIEGLIQIIAGNRGINESVVREAISWDGTSGGEPRSSSGEARLTEPVKDHACNPVVVLGYGAPQSPQSPPLCVYRALVKVLQLLEEEKRPWVFLGGPKGIVETTWREWNRSGTATSAVSVIQTLRREKRLQTVYGLPLSRDTTSLMPWHAAAERYIQLEVTTAVSTVVSDVGSPTAFDFSEERYSAVISATLSHDELNEEEER